MKFLSYSFSLLQVYPKGHRSRFESISRYRCHLMCRIWSLESWERREQNKTGSHDLRCELQVVQVDEHITLPNEPSSSRKDCLMLKKEPGDIISRTPASSELVDAPQDGQASQAVELATCAYPVVKIETECITDALAAKLSASLLGHILFLKNQVPLWADKTNSELFTWLFM